MWERLAVVGDLVQRLQGRSELGKTKLQKLVFLMEELENLDLNYRFHFYNYGPFSNALAGDVGYLEEVGLLSVDFDKVGGSFQIAPNADTPKLVEKGENFLQQKAAIISKIVDAFGSKSARELELASTIVYVSKRDPDYEKGDHGRLVSVTKALKPKYAQGEIEAAIEGLKKLGYLSKNSEHV